MLLASENVAVVAIDTDPITSSKGDEAVRVRDSKFGHLVFEVNLKISATTYTRLSPP